jgi:type I restriction-modification system DNA methylase subunit
MIKSKHRINEFGEVFTQEREVKAMLDLVEDETNRIDSRFLEPACGDGNFLIEVLRRKLNVVEVRYSKSKLEFERYTFSAIASLYGIDLLEDNVRDCRSRLFKYVEERYSKSFKKDLDSRFLKAVNFVLSKNIIHGDALTLTQAGTNKPIVFTEWAFATGSKVRQTEYTFNNLLAYQPFEEGSLFSDLGEEAFLPEPLKSHPLRHYLELSDERI